ncbi:hypothetical protein MRX96_004198 [Rhipicephalus microplus]
MPNMKNKMSKRVSCRQRYKVEKKVRQHLKKKRREAKKNPSKRECQQKRILSQMRISR